MFARLRLLFELVCVYVRNATSAASDQWNRLWFLPADTTTLCLIRVLAGVMLFYSHAIWTLDLEAFFGEQSWMTRDVVNQMFADGYTWSILSWCRTPASLWAMHVLTLTTFALLTIGLWTRAVSVLAFLCTISYAYRTPGALYGLDQVNGFLSLYLMLGPSGSRFSVDAWRAKRAGRSLDRPSVTANIAVRLMQCQLCVIYLFAGLSKLQGQTWWTGLAVWGGVANQEYQTLDLTWLADWPLLVNFLTHATVAWEISYCVLIWNRWTRPLVLLGAVAIHLGIVTALGMPTFGLAMLIANLSFVSPQLIRLFFEPIAVEGSSSRTSEATSELLSATSGRRVDGPTGDRLRTPLLSPSRPPRVKSK
ncbi:MAG: HTTM domain-containing protein [Planctomycetia bacterium]|nr:HTTM domain-containing protein [Planctomycetia bacterium]